MLKVVIPEDWKLVLNDFLDIFLAEDICIKDASDYNFRNLMMMLMLMCKSSKNNIAK